MLVKCVQQERIQEEIQQHVNNVFLVIIHQQEDPKNVQNVQQEVIQLLELHLVSRVRVCIILLQGHQYVSHVIHCVKPVQILMANVQVVMEGIICQTENALHVQLEHIQLVDKQQVVYHVLMGNIHQRKQRNVHHVKKDVMDIA